QAVAGEIAELVVLQQHVGLARQLAYELRALGLGDVDGDRLLAAVGAAEIGRFARLLAVGVADVRRRECARVVTLAGPLDLDDLGAQVAQVLAGPWAGQDARHVEHADMRKRSCHDSTFLSIASNGGGAGRRTLLRRAPLQRTGRPAAAATA